ncbi:hypothetical protein TKK_0006046 [Trichogramma kaykai]
MSFLHTQSCECLKSELLLFDIPPTQTTIEESNWIHYKPISSLTDNSPIEFVVPGNGEDYIDLAHTMLNLRVSIVRKTGSVSADTNQGLAKRRAFLNENSVDLLGHLHCDVFNQEKLLLNGVEVRVRLVKSRDNFALMDPDDVYKIQIDEANLIVRKVKISPSIQISHAKTLMKTTAKYPLTRVEVKAITMHSGIHGETIDNIILGQLPKRIRIGFVENKAYNGDKKLNPFNFKHFNINFLCLYIDGIQIPSKPLQPDFTKRNTYIDAYHTLFSGTGIHFLNDGNDLSRSEYPNGYCLFAFDLIPDLSTNALTHWNLIKHGCVRLDVRFAEALTSTVNCIVYAEYENILEIDASRQVIIDFSV